MEIKIYKLYNDVILPTKAHSTDACFDIYANISEPVYISPGVTKNIPAGFKTEIPQGYYAAIYARSGLGIKYGIRLANDVGIIDSDYRGEWVIALHNDGDLFYCVNPGDRIAQFIINEILLCDLVEVQELSQTNRGEGGFGSSGK